MKEVIVHPKPDIWTEIHEIPIPIPGPDEVVIRVIVAGANVKDWLHITNLNLSMNSGEDIAGIVYSFGENLRKTAEFHIGDRVAAFHPMLTSHGAYAEYAIAPQNTIFKIPDGTSFEEAATIPLIATTAAISLFRRQSLPPPWTPRPTSHPALPLLIYGASSALGTTAIKLALASNIHPIIAIAGANTTHLLSLLDTSKGDALIDYRIGSEAMKLEVIKKLNGLKCHHALDAISTNATWIPISQLLSPSTPTQHSYLSVVSGAHTYDSPELQPGVEIIYTYVGTAHSGEYKPGMVKQPLDKESVRGDVEWVFLFFRYVNRMLADGRLSGHPFVVIEGGLGGVGEGLRSLKEGGARGRKFVFKVGEV